MQQENYSGDNSGRYASGPTQNPQYVLSSDDPQNAQSMMAGMQQSPINVKSQPPPYPGTTPLPSMTHTFSQQMQPQFPQQVPYQNPQPQFQPQQSYNIGSVQGGSNIPSLSPSGRAVQQGMSLSPGASGLPRKSLAGMMSPIRAQPMNMPPPSPPVVMGNRMQGPISPLSVYMSQAQSPQRRTQVGHMQGVQARSYPPPQSPVYPHQPMGYSYGPQQAPVPQTSPVPSPRYVDPSQHGQMSPLLPGQGHLRSPQPVGTPGVQGPKSPFKVARQLNMGASSNQPFQSGMGGTQQWQYASRSASQEMWESVPVTPVIPSLPVLSADTLDLLSTLTVSTVTSPMQSSTVSSVTETHMQKSPLLQQHLLMPAKPIRSMPSIEGNLLTVSTTLATPITTVPSSRVTQAVGHRQPAKTEAPPSRSNLKRSVRQTSISSSIEKPLIYLNEPTASTSACCVSTNTLTSSIVTSVCKAKTEDPVKGETMTTPTSANGLATASVADNTILPTGAALPNTTPMDVSTVTADDPDGTDAPELPPVPPEILVKRTQLCEVYRTKLQEKLSLYRECLTELFFLRNDGNFMDYVQFKKRPSNKLVEYLKTMMPDSGQGGKKLRKISHESVTSNGEAMSPASDTSNASARKISSDDGKKGRFRSVSHDATLEKVPVLSSAIPKNRSQSQDKTSSMAVSQIAPAAKAVMSPNAQLNHSSMKGQSSPLRLKRLTKQVATASLDESIGSQEEILERAKQEAVIQRKVVELRKQGLWTQRRLPKVQEPPRNKTHWDYLLEEMRWLAADFAQERKWKRAAARKLVRSVAAYHKEQHDMALRAKREEQNRVRRIASSMAREIRIFWGNIGKVVEYKQRSLLDEKRQKALDLHLSYIVDQTEKYSDWLTQGLNKQQGSGASSPARSLGSSRPGSDDEFLPQGESSDDEETIAVAEEELEKSENAEDEISLLKQESQLPFDELLSSLPTELIENIGKPLEEQKKDSAEAPQKVEEPETVKMEPAASDKDEENDSDEEGVTSKRTAISLRRSARKRKIDSTDSTAKDESDPAKKSKVETTETAEGDEEFKAEEEEGAGDDDEATMEEEERKESVDHKKEIADLEAEGEMPIEELMKMYGAAFDQDPDEEDKGEEEEDDKPDDSPKADNEEEESSSEDEENEDEKIEEEEIGMDYLLKADLTKDDNAPMIIPADKTEEKKTDDGESSPSKEITDVAAEAASLQPTGFTLATTQVVTPIPVLLKHKLREYQHIGLDWLVTMYDKRLNGILADEMGLGKTIQTIALLAHLACEKGVWGPHLIVVPTSVMLNWEMEFKKWCPGFKILTYYGSQKERKAKRTGWTKSNAFHVCITSYKLVLQDNVSFRRKKWKYLVLDEAQNIKNFKSQRWQTLLNFNSQRRLLLTGTPLQNNLMELWSLMHFLMPHVFQSHKEFKEWFSNPLTGMIEGSQEYNEKLVRRLHKVLRPFLLRRIKKDVEKQMPNKYEHVIRCHLSKRQRFLYDDFMSQASTKDTLESGHFMSVINILMQLRKVCNHPNLFEPRAIVSPFMSDQIDFHSPSLVTKVLDKDPFETLNLQDYHLHLPSLANIHRSHAERVHDLKIKKKLIEELDENGNTVDERPSTPKALNIREHLSNLLKEREKQKARNITTLNISQQSLHLLQHGQQASSLPVLTIPITTGTGSLQLNTSTGATIIPSRVITIPQSKSEDASSRTSTSQSFTLQYQTPQGTRVTIPNKQIRQLPGGVVQIMTPGAAAKAQDSSTQPVVSIPVSSQGSTALQNGDIAIDDAKTEDMDVDKKGKGKTEKLELKDPASYEERLEEQFLREHKERCLRMARINEKRCEAMPEWMPRDTIDFLKNIYRRPELEQSKDTEKLGSNAMRELLKSKRTVFKEMKPISDRFVFVIPKVEAKHIDFHVSHPAPSRMVAESAMTESLEKTLKKEVAPLHSINLAMRITFPEARLIQYDCGKLQVLDVLLRRFWAEKHKCLIFTQMTKVLDILEAFLSYHGYRYLRLDGSTRVEQRMLLMERFNQDPRIFCFILSTRSGGIGVNLTGADTVIFYDSDWNPTMDAQAQDRCHRIGQTRDVHIYRLISERTVEENILKKANQKRLLGDLAIEGGSFTTAFFKEQAIKDLFNEPSGLEDLPSAVEKSEKQPQPAAAPLSKPITARQKAIAAAKEAEAKTEVTATSSDVKPAEPKASSWEDALQQTEDKEDVDAAKQLKEEQDADMEEFTETAEGEEGREVSRVHEEMKSIYEELTPIEKYALRYLEETTEEMNREELELAEEQVHRSKQDWEIAHLVALKEEEERRLEEEEDEIFYTRDDAENQIFIDDVTGETMPIWFPPTPPQDENDIYIDAIARLLYLLGPMPDDQLPVIHVKRERKRTKTESDSPGGVPSQKRRISRAEFRAPRSLFNRPLSQYKKKELKIPRYRTQLKKPLQSDKTYNIPSLPTISSPVEKASVASVLEQQTDLGATPTSSATGATDQSGVTSVTSAIKNLDWLINEDWKLLQAVQEVLDMPLSLLVRMPAHTPNWDLVADIVNSVSSVYRSPKVCKQRFENVVAPREEGKHHMEVSQPKKTKGMKTPTKPKISKLQKTTNMHTVDNNAQYSNLFTNRFGAIKYTCSKRAMPIKSSSSGQFQRNPKHTNILMDNGITYDKPLPPVQVASQRADRILREKQAIEVAKQQQQLVQSHSMQTLHPTNVQQISSGQGTKAGLSGLGQLTAIPLSGSTSNIIVNTSALSAAITKKINQTASKTSGNTALQQTLLRTASSGDQTQTMQQQPQIQIQQHGQVGTMVTVGLLHRLPNSSSTTSVTTAATNNNTITLSSLTRPSITVPTGTVIQGSQQIHKQLAKQRLQQQHMQLQLKQQKKPVKAQMTATGQAQKLQAHVITPEAIKKLRQRQQQQQQQQLEANVVTVAKVASKQRKPTAFTQQELEQLLKSQTLKRPMQKPQSAQVQIAPIHAQVQAQQVQEAAAQQAAQHVITSKPLPITVPVSNLVSVAAVNLGGMNMSISSTNAGTSGQAKPLVMTGQQVPVSIQQLQRQLLKHRMVTQQQQAQPQLQAQQVQQGQVLASKVGGKQTVYAMVAGPLSGTPLVTQRKGRVNVAASSGQVVSSQGQPGVQLTVTKLLQSQPLAGQAVTQIKQSQQSADALQQQVRQQQASGQQLQVASATLVPSSNITQQQRLITPQRQVRQIQQLATNQQGTQMILTPASSQQFLQRPSQNVVASISISAPSIGASSAQQQMTLSAPNQQQTSLSQQLQNLFNPQVIRAQSGVQVAAQTAMRTTGQQHHLVLSQVNPQQTLSINPQTPVLQMTSPTTPTTMTLAPSLVQLPASASVVGAQTQPLMSQTSMPDGSVTLQQPTATSAQYVTRTQQPR